MRLTEKQWDEIKAEIKLMLHASRDAMRTQFENKNSPYDPKRVRFLVWDGYYGEAFGILRTLHILGCGTLGQACNIPEERNNLRWWFCEIEKEVLEEEGFNKSGSCAICKERYGR